MSLYRCPICGSPNVTKHESNDGFSYKKALVGTMVFGDIGAVAGINGKKNTEYTCADCSQTSKHPMDDYQRDLIDTSMILYDIFEQQHPDLVSRYAYLRKEIAQRKASKNTEKTFVVAPATSESVSNIDITLTDFMDAAKQWRDLFCYGNISIPKVYESFSKNCDAEHAPLDLYITALHDLPKKITLALPKYANYISHDRFGNSELGSTYLSQAVLYYALQLFGDNISHEELYDHYLKTPVLHYAMDVLQRRKFTPDPGMPDFHNRLEAIMHMESQFGLSSVSFTHATRFSVVQDNGKATGTSRTKREIQRGILIIDGSLYVRFPNVEAQFEQAMPDVKYMIDDLQKTIDRTKKDIAASIDSAIENKTRTIRNEVSKIKAEITQHEENIAKLRRKIFGKQKANAEAENLTAQVNSLTARIRKLTQEETDYKQAMQSERENRIESAYEANQNKLNELLQQKKEFIQNAGLICLIAPEA